MNETFVKNMLSMHGDEGQKWLDSIPSIIETFEKKWAITVGEPYELTYNYVAQATKVDGGTAVIKIGFPGTQDFLAEIRALQFYRGEGAVRLYEADQERFVMLLEKIEPGTSLLSLGNDAERVSLLAEVIKKIDKPFEDLHSFQSIVDLSKGFDRCRARHNGTTGPFPKDLFEKAESIFTMYRPEVQPNYLLHADLHEGNVLLSERGWLAIDPMGVIGVPEYEVAMFLNDPFSDMPEATNHKDIVSKRIYQLSEALMYDKNVIRNWAFAQAMLSTLWRYEDHNEVSEIGIKNATLLDSITF